jgi:small subunit ribosomal protein S2
MSRVSHKELLEAGVHFGHLKRKWNPAMAPYIFMEKSGIHIIDLHKTAAKVNEAAEALKKIAESGRKILFVATKKQAKEVLVDKLDGVMPYVTERWQGGMLTNFGTIRKSIKKMKTIENMRTDGTFDNISKREKLQKERTRDKIDKNLGSIADLTRLPAALFIVDTTKEHIAVAEARKLNIPTFAMVDTNSNPGDVDYAIPANDDAKKSISVIIDVMAKAIAEGLEDRKKNKDAQAAAKAKEVEEKEETEPKKKETKKPAAKKVDVKEA